jgi:protease I
MKNNYIAEPCEQKHGEQILIMLADEFNDMEFFYPYYRLLEEGYCVSVAGLKKGDCTGKYQMKFPIDLLMDDVKPENYDALFVPGGNCPEFLRKNPKVIELVKQFNNKSKPILSICHGPVVLLDAGIIKGKKVTGFPEIKDVLINGGAIYEDKSAVRDKNIVTSRKPGDLPNFMKQFLKIMKDRL